jgi:hypothetical protein
VDGDIHVIVHRQPLSGTVRADFCVEARPTQVELGHLEFDLTDDAELVAYAMILRLLQKGGVHVTTRAGVSIDATELEEILDR